MTATVSPSEISGSVNAPVSKSAMQRACAAALLRKGISIIHHPGHSNDDKAALEVIRQLGALVSRDHDTLVIASNGVAPVSDRMHCGESGLGIRMFTPIAALSERAVTITGEGSLVTRPMHFFDGILPQLGVSIVSAGGRLPLKIQGPMKPVNIEVDGSLSSQFITGLLMAYSAAGAKGVSINVHDLKSKPYIDLTLEIMADFGLKLPHNEAYQRFYFDDASTPLNTSTMHYTVEGDWSGAAFLLVAGAVSGNIHVAGIRQASSQADRRVMQALHDAGVQMQVNETAVEISRSQLRSFSFDATDCPDLFPPLVALAAHANGTSQITGVGRLAHKESDRAKTLQEEFAKLGVSIIVDGDVMMVTGSGKIMVQHDQLHSHHDHRIAMACAVAALSADKPVHIAGAEAVNKSYPSFWSDMKQLNAEVSLSS